MKCCRSCEATKPLSDFPSDKRNADGRQATCKVCKGLKAKAWYQANKVSALELRRKWYGANKERNLAMSKARYEADRANRMAQQKAWRRANPEKMAEHRRRKHVANLANSAAHRAAKRNALPQWADRQAIKDVYAEAAYMQLHVDHIVPLRSKLVCGLHVWSNLELIPAALNHAKGNRYWPDMP